MTSNQKVYFSKALDPTNWNDNDSDYMTFFLVPRKWWSIEAWKLANSLRFRMLSKLTELIK
jgi:hypothetical protein